MDTPVEKPEPADNAPPPSQATGEPFVPIGRLDQWLDAPMWITSLLFLILFAGVLQEIRSGSVWTFDFWPFDISFSALGILVLWPLFALEWILHIFAGSRNRWRHAAYCFVPPLRMGGRDHATWKHIWFPFTGWERVDRTLVRRIE